MRHGISRCRGYLSNRFPPFSAKSYPSATLTKSRAIARLITTASTVRCMGSSHERDSSRPESSHDMEHTVCRGRCLSAKGLILARIEAQGLAGQMAYADWARHGKCRSWGATSAFGPEMELVWLGFGGRIGG